MTVWSSWSARGFTWGFRKFLVTRPTFHPSAILKFVVQRKELEQVQRFMNAGAIIDQGAPRKRRFLAVQN